MNDRRRQIDFHPDLGRIAGLGWRSCQADAAAYDHGEAVNSFSGYLANKGRLRLGLLAVESPVAAVRRLPKFDGGHPGRPGVLDFEVEADALAVDVARAGRCGAAILPPFRIAAGARGAEILSARRDRDPIFAFVASQVADMQADLHRPGCAGVPGV